MTFMMEVKNSSRPEEGSLSIFPKDVSSRIRSAGDKTCDWTMDGLLSRPTEHRPRVSEATVDISLWKVNQVQTDTT